MSAARARAKTHINSFRAKRHLREDDDSIDPDNLNLADLARALKITSSQLYADNFHFVWEIIQNNDDAEYKAQQPQLRFVLTDDTLHAWSNQTGFSKADVNSLCSVGNSSKKDKVETIGEKGIGFKSLFTVADRVTIRSEPYHFKFDTTTALGDIGMVVPTWIEEAASLDNGTFKPPFDGTTVSLHLKPGTNVKALRDKLEGLNFSFLIFCRRLKKLEISYKGASTAFNKSGELRDQTSSNVTLHVQKNSTQSKKWHFQLFSKQLTDMPRQPERPHQSTSIVRLAFELPKDWTDGLMDEETYAFMPMRKFGFKFMIHANFILTANRGEVLHHHEWNKRLRSGLEDLVHFALVWFATAEESPARFKWLYYAESLFSVTDIFFAPLCTNVRTRLKTTPLLMTDAADADFFQTPARALFVSSDFRSDGKLILDGANISKRSIDLRYAAVSTLKNVLVKLGMEQFGHYHFICEFETMVKTETVNFRARAPQWHSSVASVLLVSKQQFAGPFSTKCRELDIVPLASGEWTAPKSSNVYLPGGETQDIPTGLVVKVVHTAASEDRNRRFLFESLGIKQCTRDLICNSILARHQFRQFGSLKDTVSELKFLFYSNYEPKPSSFFYFYSSLPNVDSSKEKVHIPFGELGGEIRKQLGEASSRLLWLDQSYETIASPQNLEKFVKWLDQWPQVRLWPKICREHKLASLMIKLLSSHGSRSVLAHFLYRVKNGQVFPFEDLIWRTEVDNLEVATDQGTRKLCDTAMPHISALSGGMIPALDIPDPSDPNWSFLSEFGVLFSADARFLLQKLRNTKASGTTALNDKTVSKIYNELGKLTAEKQTIRAAFESDDLIYLGHSRWTKIRSCRWKATYHCTLFPLLSNTFKGCSGLFRDILGIEPANLTDLLDELKSWEMIAEAGDVDVDTAETLYQLLLELNRMLGGKNATHAQLSTMRNLRMFPVFNAATNLENMSIEVLRYNDKFWIGDMPSLQNRFRSRAPLLLPLQDTMISQLNAVFQALEMDKKRLTRCVINEFASDGYLGPMDEELTDILRTKVPYFVSLLQHAEEVQDNRKTFITQIKKLRVQRVAGITLRRYLPDKSHRIYGTDEEGELCLKPAGTQLVIHVEIEMPETDFMSSLADHLSQYWNLQDKHSHLISKIATSTSPKRYIEALEKAGISLPDSNETISPWNTPKRKGGRANAKSPLVNGNSRSIPSNSLLTEETDNIIEISEDEPNDKNSGCASAPRRSLRNRKGDSSPLQSDDPISARWVQDVSKEFLTDDTAIQHASLTRKRKGIPQTVPRRVSHASDRQTHTKSDDPVIVEIGYPVASTNKHYGRSQRTTRSSSTMQLSNSQEPFAESTPTLGGLNDPMSILGALSSSRRPDPEAGAMGSPSKKRKVMGDAVSGTQDQETNHAIGRAGEHLVHNFLFRTLGPSFSRHNWTSRNREVFFPAEPFTGEEWDYSDFTYKDAQGKLGEYLAKSVPVFTAPSGSAVAPTYHLEVKTTLLDIDQPATLSNNQIRMAKTFSNAGRSTGTVQQTDVYVLVRVYNLKSGNPPAPKICFYPDPWDLICRGELAIEGDEGLYVRPAYI